MILLIDNYDSFSYNLYQLVGSIDPDIRVERKDGRFYFPDAAGLPCHFDMGRLDKEGFLKSKKIIGA